MSEVISQELKYDTKIANHSSIQYRNVSPQNNTSVVTNITSSTGPTEFIISPACFVPSKSRLEFTLQLPTTASTSVFNYVDANLLTSISRLVVYDSATNAVLVDVSNFEKYASLMSPSNTSMEEFLYKANGGSNTDEASAQLLTVEDIARFTGSSGNADGDNTEMGLLNPVFGRQQFYVGSASATLGDFIDVSIPFSAFKGTVLNTNKVLYFPTNLVIQIYWNASNQYAFKAGSATNPTTSVATLGSAVVVNNINVVLACESNLSIISQVIQTTMSSGITFQIPYPTVTRQSVASSVAHSYSLQLTRAYGNRILYLLSAPFVSGGVNNTANIHSRGTITVYNTYLNNIAIKYPPSFNALKSEDYIIGNKEYLKGSVVQNLREYINSNWMHCDSFFGEKGLPSVDYSDIDGLDVGTASSTYQLQATLSSATAYTWVTIIMGTKTLKISNIGSSVM